MQLRRYSESARVIGDRDRTTVCRRERPLIGDFRGDHVGEQRYLFLTLGDAGVRPKEKAWRNADAKGPGRLERIRVEAVLLDEPLGVVDDD